MKSLTISKISLPIALIAAAVSASPALAHGGAMGQGYGYGSAAPCYGQHGMMGPGMMGQGMGSPSGGTAPYRDRDLTVDEVKSILEHRLEHHANERLRVGKVEEKDDDVIIAEVETVDGSLVERYAVDRHTGRMQRSK
jgi:hypothetical protein